MQTQAYSVLAPGPSEAQAPWPGREGGCASAGGTSPGSESVVVGGQGAGLPLSACSSVTGRDWGNLSPDHCPPPPSVGANEKAEVHPGGHAARTTPAPCRPSPDAFLWPRDSWAAQHSTWRAAWLLHSGDGPTDARRGGACPQPRAGDGRAFTRSSVPACFSGSSLDTRDRSPTWESLLCWEAGGQGRASPPCRLQDRDGPWAGGPALTRVVRTAQCVSRNVKEKAQFTGTRSPGAEGRACPGGTRRRSNTSPEPRGRQPPRPGLSRGALPLGGRGVSPAEEGLHQGPWHHPRGRSLHGEETGLFTACFSLVAPCHPELTRTASCFLYSSHGPFAAGTWRWGDRSPAHQTGVRVPPGRPPVRWQSQETPSPWQMRFPEPPTLAGGPAPAFARFTCTVRAQTYMHQWPLNMSVWGTWCFF